MAPAKKTSLKRKSDDGGGKKKAASSSSSLPVQLDDDVPDFPRGGGGVLSRKEKDEIRAEVDAEFDKEDIPSNYKRRKTPTDRKKKNKLDAKDDELGSLFGDVLRGKLPRIANKVTMKNICPGMKLWGVISEVNEKDLVVSLSGGLRGLVRASEAIDTALIDSIKANGENYVLSSIFHLGQLVSSIVLQVEDDKKTGKRKVWLSLRLSLLHKSLTFDAVQEGMTLTAYVKSVEDHGYLLHFGVSSFTGFLPKKSDDREIKLSSGQLIQGAVKTTDKVRKVVHLCCDADEVAKCVTKDLKGISLDLLVPGMMVNARVQATLVNGIMLSFLTYFTGTVDVFHLAEMLPSFDWKKKYEKNKNVIARILFIDPSTRAVGLTMNKSLILNKAPHLPVSVGDVYDHSKIIRVDRGVGLLLEVPSIPVSAPVYVTIGDAADGAASRQLEKKFKVGSHVRARILGFRHLEGLAMGLLKESAFESEIFTHSDVKPGIIVKAKVISVNNSGAIVQFPSGVKALCPLQHMSEFYISKPRKKFKVGTELSFRVLGCKSKRITVTHKKSLLKSKLFILASHADATDGLITHGWISNIEKHGCFVKFYNGVQGFAPRAELGLEAGGDISSMYHVGQVVKCRVTSSIPAHHRITLSFIMSPKVSGDETVKLGSLVSGVVEEVTPRAVLLHVNSKGNMKGSIYNEQLADHQGLATPLKSVLKKGDDFAELVVLDIEGNNLILSAKYSLVHTAEQLPAAVTQIQPHSVIHGYICNLIDTGCFVRFLGHFTAFSPRRKAVDDQTIDLSKAFYIGQSVRSKVLDVDNNTGRVTVSLKQSSCSSTDESFIQSYFLSKDRIAKSQVSDSTGSVFSWCENFAVGSVVDCTVREIEEFGVIVGFDKWTDVAGFISQSQLSGSTVKTGTTIQAAVLDVVKAERLVDLSLKPEFIIKNSKDLSASTKKKRKRDDASKELKELTSVDAIVEIVKDDYLVLSLPEHNNAIGYAMVTDYNTQKLPRKQFLNGERVKATIVTLPSASTDGRLLLLLDSVRNASETSSSKKEKKKSSYDIGSLVQAEIIEVKPFELCVKFGVGFRGRIHITEVNDDCSVENPLAAYKMGQTLKAKIVGKPAAHGGGGKKGSQWELSVKPSVVSGSDGVQEKLTFEECSFSIGQRVSGYVSKVENDWIWLMISRQVSGQIFILDSSIQPKQLNQFQKRFEVGHSVSGSIISVNKDKKLLRLSLCELSDGTEHPDTHDVQKILAEKGASHIHEGDVVGGRITKILPGVGGMLVQIGPHLYGKVHYTEIKDDWVSDPLSGYKEEQFVKCKVLEFGRSVTGSVHVDLSLRPSLEGISKSPRTASKAGSKGMYPDKSEDFHPNMVVQGYVKSVTPKGCFVTLSRNVDAKILLGNLSDGYIEDPQKEFPVGALVTGKVLSVDPLSKRVEVTLRSSDGSSKAKSNTIDDLRRLSVGDVVCGKVKRVESFGLFITIENSNLVGLCHISEIADDHVDSIETIYKTGERVTAKVLKIDEDRQRISLGMKPSYMGDDVHATDTNGSVGDMIIASDADSDDVANISDSENEADVDGLGMAEDGDSVPPLEVNLEDIEEDEEGANGSVEKDADDAVDKSTTDDEKSKRKAKKKAREEREQEIRAAEERLLQEDKPKTTNDYEKLVRKSPNSSFIWIQYMAMMLSLADVEGAREVARRALKTINMTHETEKLNVWVAYLNLENDYGNPPEEAVAKVFNEALQFCDPLKLHLELLGLYERTKQEKLGDELLEKMMKKFKNSPEVWLRRIQWLLTQDQEGDVEKVITRALMSLPRHQKTHISFLTQVCLLEFKCGSPDKGRSLFEKILRENPKRIDLWSVYLDQEIKLGDVELIRALFERATSLNLPLKKMQFLFKKYIDYEDSQGDEERVCYVAQKAREYYDTVVGQ